MVGYETQLCNLLLKLASLELGSLAHKLQFGNFCLGLAHFGSRNNYSCHLSSQACRCRRNQIKLAPYRCRMNLLTACRCMDCLPQENACRLLEIVEHLIKHSLKQPKWLRPQKSIIRRPAKPAEGQSIFSTCLQIFSWRSKIKNIVKYWGLGRPRGLRKTKVFFPRGLQQ